MHKSDQLLKIAIFYNREARRCSEARAYLAASILQASALEAALTHMCFVFPEQVKKTTIFQHKRFRGKRNKALELRLHELITLATECGWFPAQPLFWAKRKMHLSNLVHAVRDIRNFVHAGKWARNYATKIDKHTYKAVYEIFDVARLWLLHHVNESLRRKMKREGILS